MEHSQQTKNNRMVLLLIAGIPLIMILGASWLWYFVVRGDLDLVGALGTANNGTLVQPPRQIDELLLYDQNGVAFPYADLEPKWALLVPGMGDDCDAACEENLYITRQIHVALGKNFNRVRRLYVSEGSTADISLAVGELSDGHPVTATFTDYLAQEHRGLKALVLEPDGGQRLFPEARQDPGTWYLVDPAGWIMMSYSSDTSYKDVIADLKFLLKNSGG
jgi:hypothetical protein